VYKKGERQYKKKQKEEGKFGGTGRRPSLSGARKKEGVPGVARRRREKSTWRLEKEETYYQQKHKKDDRNG